MKNLIVAVTMFVMLFFWSLSVHAEDCERYWEELVEQTFEINFEDTDYVLEFGDSVCGPCPTGTAYLSYTDTTIVNDVENSADLVFELRYDTSRDAVTIADIDFLLHAGKLIMLPDEPLIFNVIEN